MKLRAVASKDGVRAEAARWAVWSDKGVGTDDERAQFEAWLETPGNLDAYDRSAAALELLDDLDEDTFADIKTLRSEALEYMPTRRRWLPLAGLAAAASIAAAIGITLTGPSPTAPRAPMAARSAPGLAPKPTVQQASIAAPRSYATAVGEQRVVTLEDGTKVTMDTSTQIAVVYSAGRRVVRLLHGQALFDVFHNPNRPFSVVAGNRQVTALGTIFEVRNLRGGVEVTLIKGRVVVDQSSSAAAAKIAPTYLSPGQQFVSTAVAAPQIRAVDIGRTLLWRQSLVEFSDESMGDAVTELNRYSTQPLVITDPGVRAMRISGVFRTGDPQGFADLIAKMLPIASRENARGEIELSKGDDAAR